MTDEAATKPVPPKVTPPCVILNEPQLAENIGAVARVMANFGLYDLRLVRPRDGWPQELFGGERAGLETHDIALCQAIVSIPIDERFRSLNLAQAVSINAYEWKMTQDDRPWKKFDYNVEEPADQGTLLGLYEHLEGELDKAGFYHPPEKKPSMVRNLRVPLARARLSDQEVRTFRGVITALSKGRGRVLAKLAAQKAAKEADKTDD
jgi:tRNA/rRNA methyltransferase